MQDTRPNPECSECLQPLDVLDEDENGIITLYICNTYECVDFQKEHTSKYINEGCAYDQIAQDV